MKITNVHDLADLLRRASDAHHIYETVNLNGSPDANWPDWYADWILKAARQHDTNARSARLGELFLEG